MATASNTSPTNVNALNLLAPFLALNATPTGQATLTQNLNSAVAVNNDAATSQTIEQTSISDKALFGSASTTITLQNGSTAAYGPGANLGGGLPMQAVQNSPTTSGTITPYQQYGGLGQLGSAYQAAVNPSGAAVTSVVTLLTTAYSANSSDLGIAKYYFANGTTNGTTPAVAPAGYTLPTYNGLPNTANSVYDTAYGVSNKGTNQDVYGDSRPVQVAPSRFNGYDPNALTGLATNPSFPSGHTTYAYTDGILIGMLVPQDYQAMLLRASEYGNSRIDLGVHYPLDIIASRAFNQYDLSQELNGAANYTNLQAQFTAAQAPLQTYLTSQLAGGTLADAAATNPYNAYSLATYASHTPTAGATLTSNAQIYAARLAYGLPTLSFAAAPQEVAPTGGPDASILLAPLYGGSTTAAQTIAPTGGLYANLATGTIDQIIQNTEGNALAAFYGTSLSYWSRIDLYDAAGYFGNVVGALTLATTDVVNVPVTINATGVLEDDGRINGNATINNAGTLLVVGTVAGSVVVNGGGTLGGSGTTGAVTSDGTVSAGATAASVGTLTTGALTLNGDGIFREDIASASSADRVNVGGAVVLGGTLDIEAAPGFTSTAGQSITLIDNTGAQATTGAFSNLVLNGQASAIGANNTFTANGRTYQINYAANIDGGGTANDVTLTDVTATPSTPPTSTPPTSTPPTSTPPTSTPTLPAPTDAVAISPTVTYANGVFTLSGTASSTAGVRSVEISAVLNDGTRQDLGAATVNGDGTFAFQDAIGANQQGFFVATLTDGAGSTAISADPGFSLTGGLGQGGGQGRQTRYTPDGSAEAAVTRFLPNGSQRATVTGGGQTFASNFFDTFNNRGAPENTFVFNPGHGLDIVNGFRKDGADHDFLSFTGSDFGNSVAQVLQNTYGIDKNGNVIGHAGDPIAQALSGISKGAGVIVYDPVSMDTVKVNGITKGQLAANQDDITFHA